MERSHGIARLIGPVLCAVGIGMLTNQATYREMARQFLTGYPFIYFSGILALVAGLAILNVHHAWTRDWRSLITAIGWLMTLVGAYRIIGPQFVNFVGTATVAHAGFFTGAGIVLLALGGFLTFKGYAA
jgi:drug/metabolite transporter (DMT)-like permease